DPKLWYGIAILYDRWGSAENAETAFLSALAGYLPPHQAAGQPGAPPPALMTPVVIPSGDRDRDDVVAEMYFRLGIMYKLQSRWEEGAACFAHVMNFPPPPLACHDLQFQLAHCLEQMGRTGEARDLYERVVEADPAHAKALQQLGWLLHLEAAAALASRATMVTAHALQLLDRSSVADPTDAQTWYLMGRVHMSARRYNDAHACYQHAVRLDPRNASFWCSIGVLYSQIRQAHDALDAYSRAIRLDPRVAEVWYNLGTLYESCNNQMDDALDAYERAARLDPGNPHIRTRLEYVKS
ncbi:hypothetical protein BC828DRAFT_333039, partial [Blastocladiella britannica]